MSEKNVMYHRYRFRFDQFVFTSLQSINMSHNIHDNANDDEPNFDIVTPFRRINEALRERDVINRLRDDFSSSGDETIVSVGLELDTNCSTGNYIQPSPSVPLSLSPNPAPMTPVPNPIVNRSMPQPQIVKKTTEQERMKLLEGLESANTKKYTKYATNLFKSKLTRHVKCRSTNVTCI